MFGISSRSGLVRLAGLTVAAGLLAGSPSWAGTVNIDFQNGWGSQSATYSGQGAMAAPGNLWNAVAPSGNSFDPVWGDLTFSSNVAVTETGPDWAAANTNPLTFDSGTLRDSQGNMTGIAVSGATKFLYAYEGDSNVIASGFDSLMREYLDSGYAGGSDVTIRGLAAGAAYKLVLYGHGAEDFRATTFTIGGVAKSTSFVDGTNPRTSLAEGSDYVTYSSVVADSNGQIGIHYAAAYAVHGGATVNDEGSFNGLQISEVPEPSTLALCVAGMVGLLAYAWRKRK
jgi:hypothetical protein